jgi:hypothetical protein
VTAALSAVIDIVDSINPHFSNSALSAAKSHRATLLAELPAHHLIRLFAPSVTEDT